MMSWMIKSSLL